MISAWLIAIRGAFGGRGALSVNQPHCVASICAVIHGFFKQLPRRNPTRVGCLMQPSVRRSHTCCDRDYPGQLCSIANSLEVIGERWSLLIVRDVLNGNRRFGEIQASLGVARNVLSARLQRLVDEDILERRRYQESPPRYEYFLTEKGLDLWPALIALLNWGDRYSPSPGGPAEDDPPQGLRRPRQRPRHLRKLRRGPDRPRRDPGPGPGPGQRRWRRRARPSRPNSRPAPFLPAPASSARRRGRCTPSTISWSFLWLGARFIAIRWSSEATRTAMPAIDSP